MKRKTCFVALSAASVSLLLSACGGGGGDGGSSAVSGLAFATQNAVGAPLSESVARNQNNLNAALNQQYNKDFSGSLYTVKIESSDINQDQIATTPIDWTKLAGGLSNASLTEVASKTIDGVSYRAERTSNVKIYKSQNSIVLGRQAVAGALSADGVSTPINTSAPFAVDTLRGVSFNNANALGSQKFTYQGKAFDAYASGDLTYTVDFGARAGSGSIGNLGGRTIALNTAAIKTVGHTNPDGSSIQTLGAQGVATITPSSGSATTGSYTLGIFGNDASEIAGFVSENGVNTVGFGGTTK